jgi:hypothetical protein
MQSILALLLHGWLKRTQVWAASVFMESDLDRLNQEWFLPGDRDGSILRALRQ